MVSMLYKNTKWLANYNIYIYLVKSDRYCYIRKVADTV